jgi:hypothetical protein
VRSDAPDELLDSYDVLARAYPEGVPDSDYWALLAVLDEDFSNRQLAALVAAFTGRHPIDVDNDHAAAMSIRKPDPKRVVVVQQRLRVAGYSPTP